MRGPCTSECPVCHRQCFFSDDHMDIPGNWHMCGKSTNGKSHMWDANGNMKDR